MVWPARCTCAAKADPVLHYCALESICPQLSVLDDLSCVPPTGGGDGLSTASNAIVEAALEADNPCQRAITASMAELWASPSARRAALQASTPPCLHALPPPTLRLEYVLPICVETDRAGLAPLYVALIQSPRLKVPLCKCAAACGGVLP